MSAARSMPRPIQGSGIREVSCSIEYMEGKPMLGDERTRGVARQRCLKLLGQWSVPVCLAILLAVVDGLKHGWTRSLVSTGALVLVLVQAYVLVDLILLMLRPRKFEIASAWGITASIGYYSFLAVANNFKWMMFHSGTAALLAAVMLFFALRSYD